MDKNKSKNKKKTLTISSSFGKKLDSSSYKQTGKKTFLIDSSCHPQTISVVETRAKPLNIQIKLIDKIKENIIS